MDVIQRELLLRHREALVADVLQPEYLLPYLIGKGLLTPEDSNLIYSQVTPQARMRQLLDILPERGQQAFTHLCHVLENNYNWLSRLLMSEVEAVSSQSQSDEPDLKEELFLDARLRGGVPLPPPHFVFRQNEVQAVREKLQRLEPEKCLVLHGMTGSGKSCLAAAALDCKEILLGTFKGVVLWVSLGDGVLAAQRNLLHKLERHWPLQQQSTFHSLPSTEDMARDALIARLLLRCPPALKHGLLVLDDISSQTAARSFNVGLRMLILTQDLSTLTPLGPNCSVIQMVPGFSETESLELLAASVNMQTEDLWPQALEIHRKAWGFPLVISLVGGMLSEYKEDARSSSTRWQQYSEMLSRQHRCRRNSLSRPGLMEAITLSVNTLPTQLRLRYHQLVVFDDDVNILPEVLSTLWSISKYEVEENMCVLVKKCLASRRWNEELRCYVYGVHYLLLHYLHATLPVEKVQECHVTLVQRYEKLVGGDWSRLPNDNYAHLFLAQHMVKADLARNMLPSLLLSIDFVAKRLRLNVPADLQRDFLRLRETADSSDDLLIKLHDYETFVMRWGELLRQYCFLDPVQCALQEPPASYVHQAAFKLAITKNDAISYFTTMHVPLTVESEENENTCLKEGSLEFDGKYCTAALCCQHVLLGQHDGSIILLDTELNRTLHLFSGLQRPAVSLKVSENHEVFAAASDAGEVFMWTLPPGYCSCQSVDTAPTPPPRLRQPSWQPLHGETEEAAPVVLTTNVSSCSSACLAFSASGDLLAWCCPEKLVVWCRAHGSVNLLWFLDKLEGAIAVEFGMRDNVLFVAAGDIYMCEARTGKVLHSLPANKPARIMPSKGESPGWCLELSGRQLCQWEWWGRICGTGWAPTSRLLKIGDDPKLVVDSAVLSADQSLLGVITEDAELMVVRQESQSLLSCVPVPPYFSLVGLEPMNLTGLRALLKASDGRVAIKDVNVDSSAHASSTSGVPLWCNSQKWSAHLCSSGELRVLRDNNVFVAKKVTAVASDGEILALGTRKGELAVVQISQLIPECKVLARLHAPITHLSVSQGCIIASTNAQELAVWSCQRVCQYVGLSSSSVIQCHVINTFLLVCSADGIQVWDTQQNKVTTLVSGEEVVTAFALHRNTMTVALATSSCHMNRVKIGQVGLKPLPFFLLLHSFEIPGPAHCLSLSLDCSKLAVVVTSQQLLLLVDVNKRRIVAEGRHSLLETVNQIHLDHSNLITSGAFLAWWRISQPHLELEQALQLEQQYGSLKFVWNEKSCDILVSDSRNSLWVVKRVGTSSQVFETRQQPRREHSLQIKDTINTQKDDDGVFHTTM